MNPSVRRQVRNTKIVWALMIVCGLMRLSFAQDPPKTSVEQERLEVMRAHATAMEFRANVAGFPEKVLDQPLFRYDDQARGYIDGAVWRLGASGRPKAIVTTELHPNFFNAQTMICDYLSLSETPFVAKVAPGITWSPTESAAKLMTLPGGPKLAASKPQRLLQLKKIAERFSGHQTVEGKELELRLLPRPIDRYQPSEQNDSDASIFVFVSGRMPGILLVIEAIDDEWQFGPGRLSGHSSLSLKLDGKDVWQVEPVNRNLSWRAPYTANHFPVKIPGIDAK